MLSPGLLILLTVTAVPAIFVLVISLTSWSLTQPGSFVYIGADNFVALFQDRIFRNSLMVQGQLTLFGVPLTVGLGVAIALLLHSRLRIAAFGRALIIAPMVLPPVVVALIWTVLYVPDISVLNWLLRTIGLGNPAWLSDPTLALFAIIIADSWQWFPFATLITLAALQSLPEEPLEAAKVDGATYWQTVWHIVLPLLRPTLAIIIMFRVIESIKAFPLIFIVTSGGPGYATNPTGFYTYQQAFRYSLMGYGGASTVVLIAMTITVLAVFARVVGSQE